MQNRLVTLLLVPVCTASMLVGCVKQEDYDVLQRRVYEQDMQLRQMQPAQADTWSQMQSLRQELNAVKGQLDDLQNAGGAKALVEKVNRHEAALRQVETSMAIDLGISNPSGAPAPEGTSGAETAPTAPAVAAAPAVTPAPVTPAPAQKPAVKKDTATALYDAGVAAFKARKYKEAQNSFQDFTKNFGKHKLVGNAWYYVGECNFQRNQFADAALAYDTVITKYGTSQRAPAAYLKQGIAFSKMGQKAAARARMQELIKKFPKSAEAGRAKTFLQNNK